MDVDAGCVGEAILVSFIGNLVGGLLGTYVG